MMKKKFFLFLTLIFFLALATPPSVSAFCYPWVCQNSCDMCRLSDCNDCAYCADCDIVEGSDRITNPFLNESLQEMNGVDFLGHFLPNLISIIIIIAAVASLFFLLFGGIKWITAGGDRDNLASAQKIITTAIIGLAITLSVFAVLKMIGYFFGIDLININIRPLIL